MLYDFLTANRAQLIEACRVRVATRRAPRATPKELEHGVPLFLDQLTGMLEEESRQISPERAAHGAGEMRADATRHGEELRLHGYTIDQVVHDYGDLCQSITEIADRESVPITAAEFGSLNDKLDNAIASAVTEYTRGRELSLARGRATAAQERLGMLAHEMRNLLNTTMLALSVIKSGKVGFGGATAGALNRSLVGMRSLIDRTLAEVRLEAGTPPESEWIDLESFIEEVRVTAELEAGDRGCKLVVTDVERGIGVEADRHMLASAVTNLLQNACKFTRPKSEVVLRAFASGDQALIEVEDACGGLAPGVEAKMFRPFQQHDRDRSGAGLGLTISRQAVEANGGTLRVRNVPGRGCVFTISLPRRPSRH